jgi:3-isopropylmalate/(R)-2-methylmalate dehydratase small subunit
MSEPGKPEMARASVAGTAVPVRGDDIDTDRIIPARYLRCVTFEGIEEHVFEDDRAQDRLHPFDRDASCGASVLVVNRNFGCGSSREHAPQSLSRWGIRAIVGESFAEIFFGNCVALGVPCVALSPEDVESLQDAVEDDPALEVCVDVAARTVSASRLGRQVLKFPAALPEGARESFIAGTWDATSLLLERSEEIEAIARSLPYVQGFSQ